MGKLMVGGWVAMRVTKFHCDFRKVLWRRRFPEKSGSWLVIYTGNQTHLWTNSGSGIWTCFVCAVKPHKLVSAAGKRYVHKQTYSERGGIPQSCGLCRSECLSDDACVNFHSNSMERYSETRLWSIATVNSLLYQVRIVKYTWNGLWFISDQFPLLIRLFCLHSHINGSLAGR